MYHVNINHHLLIAKPLIVKNAHIKPNLVGGVGRIHKDAESRPLVLAAKDVPLDSTLLSVPEGQSLASDMALSKSLELELNLPFLVLVWRLSPDRTLESRD